MAINVYTAVQGQSIFDVCLNTYGSLDFLYKLVQDNTFGSINNTPYSGQNFNYDTNYIVDQVISAGFKQTKLATLLNPTLVATNDTSQQINLITQRYATSNVPGSQNVVIVKNMYQQNSQDLYTAAVNGETVVSMVTWIGWDILYVEKDIKPMKPSAYTWNKSSGTFTILAPDSLAAGETIFFIFQKLITPP